MIYSVRGKLIHTEPSLAVVECAGVGMACRTTYNTLSKISGEDEVRLLTYMNVREDAIELFGFADEDELSAFKMLISVSGVGAKYALAILSDVTPAQFAMAVASGDSKLLSKTKGIGPKLASRIVLELKDKISKNADMSGCAPIDMTSPIPSNSNASEALAALVVLGYTQSEAAKVIGKLDPMMSVEDMIKTALKAMAKF